MKHLTAAERGSIETLLQEQYTNKEIAKRLGKEPSTIGREIKKGLDGNNVYHPWIAQVAYEAKRKRSKQIPKLDHPANHRLRGAVVATDVAEDMVEIARQHAKSKGLSNFEVQVADAENLPFSDHEFDAVTCRLGVMYFADPATGVQEMSRVLKPGRKLALAAWSEPAKNPWATTAAGVINKLLNLPASAPDAPGVFRCHQPGKLTELFQQADLQDPSQSEISGEAVFDSPELYWEFVTDVVAPVATPLNNVDESTREQARQAVLEATQPYQQAAKSSSPGLAG